jgi:hypothetical protein
MKAPQTKKEKTVSTPALSRHPSRTTTGLSAVLALVNLIAARLRRQLQVGKDRRVLQALPDYVLADMGLEKIEFRSTADGRRDVWVIPHRYQ